MAPTAAPEKMSSAPDAPRAECGESGRGGGEPAASPSTSTVRFGRIAIGIVLLGAAAFGFARLLGTEPDAARVMYSYEQGGLRYEYNAVAGTETLCRPGDAAAPKRNLIKERRSDAANLRHALEAELGVPSLDVLRKQHQSEIDALKRLGYF